MRHLNLLNPSQGSPLYEVARPMNEGAVVEQNIAPGADLCEDGVKKHLGIDAGLSFKSEDQLRETHYDDDIYAATSYNGYTVGHVLKLSSADNYVIPCLDRKEIIISNEAKFSSMKAQGNDINLNVSFILKDGKETQVVFDVCEM